MIPSGPAPSPRARPRIVLAGYIGYGNCGDEAMLAGALAWLMRARPDARLIALSRDPEATRRLHGCESAPALPVGDWPLARIAARPARLVSLRALRGADAAIWLAGSGMFSDTRGPILHTLWPTLRLVHRLARRFAVLSASAGPLTDAGSIALTRRVVSMCDVVALRDAASFELLSGLVSDDERKALVQTADAAFWLDPPTPLEPDLCDTLAICVPELLATAREVPRHAEYRAQFLDALATALEGFTRRSGLRPLLIPMQAGVDEPIAEELAARLTGAEVVVPAPDPARFLERMGQARLVLGMRLHSLILGALAGVPLVAVAYDAKVRAFMREIGQKEMSIDFPIWQPERPPLPAVRLQSLLQSAFDRTDTLRSEVRNQAERLRRSNREIESTLATRLFS